MKKLVPSLVLSTLLFSSCSTHYQTTYPEGVARFLASSAGSEHQAELEESLSGSTKMRAKVQVIGKKIFHAYLQGQVLLHKFDKELDRKYFPKRNILGTKVYSDLLATRNIIDELEHTMIEFYLFYAKAVAHHSTSAVEKENAQIVLDEIGLFLSGNVGLKDSIPKELRPMVLTNLMEKMTDVDETLKKLAKDPSFVQGSHETEDKIFEQRKLLRATRMSFYKEVKTFKVDDKKFQQALKKEGRKADYKSLHSEVNELGNEIHAFQEELHRNPSSDPTIFPSLGGTGNITGNGFPENTWSMTYDDGPGASTSPTALKNLQDKGLKATFFMLAQQVEKLPIISKSIKDAGMDIALHSYTHAQLTKVTPAILEKEIGTAKKVIEQKLGVAIKLFRLPYGAGVSVTNIRQKIADHKMIHVFWNVDTLDWQDKNPETIIERSWKQMNATKKNSGVILFHDIHNQSVIASSKLLDQMKEKKIKICTVQAVVDQINENKASCE